jgi:hypothetical protein
MGFLGISAHLARISLYGIMSGRGACGACGIGWATDPATDPDADPDADPDVDGNVSDMPDMRMGCRSRVSQDV